MLRKCLYCPQRYCDDEAGELAYELHLMSHVERTAEPRLTPVVQFKTYRRQGCPVRRFRNARLAKAGS